MVMGFRNAAKVIFSAVAISAMSVACLGKAFWLLWGTLALDNGPIPWVYRVNLYLFLAFLISAALFWKWPWIAVVIGWADFIAISLRINPWELGSPKAALNRFTFDLIFFIAANVGFIAAISLRRMRTLQEL
jgi:hypothetical protein